MRKQFHSGSCGKFTLIYIAKSNRKKDGMLTILRTDSTSSLLARAGQVIYCIQQGYIILK